MRCALALCVTSWFLPIWGQSAANASQTEILTREATFIFVGSVTKVNASTMPEVRPSESTAIVRVDQIMDSPGVPVDLVGQEITVKLATPASVSPNDRIEFFTKGWLVGSSLAVIEVGRTAPPQSPPDELLQIKSTHRKMADESLQNELANAVVVVYGTVLAVRPWKAPHLLTQHDPEWYEAEIIVRPVAKGPSNRRKLTVLFPNNNDRVWHRSPKFSKGQTGIWLLHRDQSGSPAGKDQLTALNPLDFQDQTQLERVRAMIKANK